jgi:ArsR family transcriptional regulator, arsenate/arsenite/antimonite-responsive transcriptional repressor
MTTPLDDELATLAKALGHPVRVQIVRLLYERGTCVRSDLSDELPVSETTAWQHLKVLKDADIIKGDIDGPKLCYCLNVAVLARLVALVDAVIPTTNRHQ